MNVIIKPLITEKMTMLSEKRNSYGFIVDKRSNKYQIKKAVKELYDVEVESVNTMNYSGKNRQRYTKSGILSGKCKSYKKAIVTLVEGDVIDFYSSI